MCLAALLLLHTDVSVLADRLSGMEGLMKELAQAQVANTVVLQQIGGRIGTSPVPPVPPGQQTYASDIYAGMRGSQGTVSHCCACIWCCCSSVAHNELTPGFGRIIAVHMA